MEKNVKNFVDIKKEIIDYIRINGPSLPSQIARKIDKPILITSAILSEMLRDKMLKITYLKIGSSPLYYLNGQEALLENFTNYLKGKEKEAVELLKKERILDNDSLESAIRVALNNAKDFAQLIRVKLDDGSEKIFWKYFLAKPEEIEEKIKKFVGRKEDKEERKDKKEEEEIKDEEEKSDKEKEIKEEVDKKKEKEEVEVKEIGRGSIKKEQKEIEVQKRLPEVVEEKKKEEAEVKKEKEKTESKKVDDFEKFINENFGLVERISKDVYTGTQEVLGEIMEFLIIVKDKKRVSDADLLLALKEGQERKMPVVLLTKGNLTKKARSVLDNSGSMIIVKKVG